LKRPTVYLAGRFARRAELARYADDLEGMGFDVRCRWLADDQADDPLYYPEAAKECVDDLLAADILIAFGEVPGEGYFSGGRHVMTGYALSQGKVVFLVGPRENVFHYLEGANLFHYPDWISLRADLACLIRMGGVMDLLTENGL
jgi:hypothetical protein